MTTYDQQATTPYSAANPGSRLTLVALIAGGLLAVLLVAAALPLLVSAGLWLLGLALTLLGYAFASNRRAATAVWGSAIAAQGLGLLGIALLFGAALLG